MNSISDLLAAKIKALRQERGLTQEELALRADVNKSFMGEIERGIASPTIKTIEKISKALDVPIAEIFAFESHTSNLVLKDSDWLGRINFAIKTRSIKEQKSVYKLIKTFLNLVDDHDPQK